MHDEQAGHPAGASELSGSRPPIRPLPPLLVNQIAAGEVIERPASVVKELIENALDAGTKRIVVELERGGTELVRVTDDGGGIPPDQLALAVSPHATSKIAAAEDLDRIGTMGFRGEALASIASVSRFTIRSRTPDGDGAEIRVEGERASEPRPATGPPGTTVEVRNLFYNTPARRKFLRTARTEQGRCADWVRDLAMSHPEVAVTLLCDGRRVLDLAPAQSSKERALALLGPELEPELIECSADAFDDARGLLLWGLVGRPSIARGTARAQHVFLNGRAIRDRTVQHALREAYRGLIEPGRHPTAVLLLEMAPDAVDVNVHPAKLEVRFRDQSMVHQTVLRTVREALQRADLTRGYSPGPGGFGRTGTEILPPPHGSEPDREERPGSQASALVEALSHGPSRVSVDGLREAVARADSPGGDWPAAEGPSAGHAPMPGVRAADRVLQVHNSYLVTQDEQGVVIIDQHALHERVMFEQLLSRIGQGDLESQRLLAPVPVDADPETVDRLEELGPLLARIGIEADAMGPRTVGVHAFPSFLFERGVEPGEFVSGLLERFGADGFAPDREAALHEVLDMMACKAAVKAGDRLSATELEAIVGMRAEVERSSNCPHGRPTSVRLTIRELERLFERR